MAQDLNKTRMRDSRILLLLTVIAGIFGKSYISQNAVLHDLFQAAGFILMGICAVGRVYATAFIGGSKNEKLVMHGPYSLCRNPLYFLSLTGAAGIGLASGHLLVFIAVTGGFLYIYDRLISREEGFLLEKFGKEFESYKASTPRLLPSFRNYNAPDEIPLQTKFLTNSLKDAVWWLAPILVFKLADVLQSAGVYRAFIPLF